MEKLLFRPTGKHRGQALVEFSLTLVIFLFALIMIIEFSRVMFGYVTLQNATRLAARYAVTGQSDPLYIADPLAGWNPQSADGSADPNDGLDAGFEGGPLNYIAPCEPRFTDESVGDVTTSFGTLNVGTAGVDTGDVEFWQPYRNARTCSIEAAALRLMTPLNLNEAAFVAQVEQEYSGSPVNAEEAQLIPGYYDISVRGAGPFIPETTDSQIIGPYQSYVLPQPHPIPCNELPTSAIVRDGNGDCLCEDGSGGSEVCTAGDTDYIWQEAYLTGGFGGRPSQVVTVQVSYRMPLITPVLNQLVPNQSILLTGTTIAINEDFGATGLLREAVLPPEVPEIPTLGASEITATAGLVDAQTFPVLLAEPDRFNLGSYDLDDDPGGTGLPIVEDPNPDFVWNAAIQEDVGGNPIGIVQQYGVYYRVDGGSLQLQAFLAADVCTPAPPYTPTPQCRVELDTFQEGSTVEWWVIARQLSDAGLPPDGVTIPPGSEMQFSQDPASPGPLETFSFVVKFPTLDPVRPISPGVDSQDTTFDFVAEPQGPTITSDNPTFVWEDQSVAEEYRLNVQTNGASRIEVAKLRYIKGNPLLTCTPGAPDQCAVSPVLDLINGPYRWGVDARDPNQFVQRLRTWFWFVVDAGTGFASAPETPLLVSPTNGDIVPTNDPTFEWIPADRTEFYTLQIWDEFGAEVISLPYDVSAVPCTTTCQVSPVLSLPAGLYTWRIVAANSQGSTASSVWDFEITQALPGAPQQVTAIAPVGNVAPDPRQLFTWHVPDGDVVTQYEIVIKGAPTFVDPRRYVLYDSLNHFTCTDIAGAFTECRITTAGAAEIMLIANGTYEWAARGRSDSAGPGPWSVGIVFWTGASTPPTVGSPPPLSMPTETPGWQDGIFQNMYLNIGDTACPAVDYLGYTWASQTANVGLQTTAGTQWGLVQSENPRNSSTGHGIRSLLPYAPLPVPVGAIDATGGSQVLPFETNGPGHLFSCRTWGADMTYRFVGLPEGYEYRITLGFAETWATSDNARVFSIDWSRDQSAWTPILTDFDIFETADLADGVDDGSGHDVAIAHTDLISLPGTGSTDLYLRLYASTNNAMLSAISLELSCPIGSAPNCEVEP
ncbi:MAG: hypothetical protein GYB68_00595 [Chloroflexi bacterium]|nr:hypothetical protein [Chloroflexota bacterium]